VNALLFLAKIDLGVPGSTPAAPNRLPSQVVPSLLLLVGLAILVLLIVILWAIFIRKPTEVRSSTPKLSQSTPQVTETEDGRLRIRKKHRKRRRDHRGRNPTLAETGGLPPGSEESTSGN
jgi:hypothetical protein